MGNNEKGSLMERIAATRARLEESTRRSDEIDRQFAEMDKDARRQGVPDVLYRLPQSKETLSPSELRAYERGREEYEERRASKALQSRESAVAAKPVSDLMTRVAATRAKLARFDELQASQKRLLEEMAANPLEHAVDAVLAEAGQKLYAVDQQELAEADEAARYLEADEAGELIDDELEVAGQPPPLQKS